jgi:hypothetical protein
MFDILNETRIDERKICVHNLLTDYSLNKTNTPNNIYFNSDIIESILFRLPLNKIWIYTLIDDYYVQHGHYIFDIEAYINDLYPLKDLKLFPEYNGFRFSELSRSLQRRIEEYSLDVVFIRIYKHSDLDTVLEKINSICLTT